MHLYKLAIFLTSLCVASGAIIPPVEITPNPAASAGITPNSEACFARGDYCNQIRVCCKGLRCLYTGVYLGVSVLFLYLSHRRL